MNAPAFIKITIIDRANPVCDHTAHFRVEDCRVIHAATELEKKQRKEINAVIQNPHGFYLIAESPATILTKIAQATSDIPGDDRE